jgi:hypothetical protein
MYRFELLMMSGKTGRNMQSVDNNKDYYTTLQLVGHASESQVIPALLSLNKFSCFSVLQK